MFSLILIFYLIFNKLSNLKLDCSCSSDCVPAYFLKFCSPFLAYPICILLKTLLSSGLCTPQWKSSFILPLHKSGVKTQVRSYRPICSISPLCSLGVLVVRRYFKTLNINQHGFLPNHSTVSNILIYSSFIKESLKKDNQVYSVYLDFTKAFNKVDVDLLLIKLNLYGIKGNLLK